jgi:hypothetical protein
MFRTTQEAASNQPTEIVVHYNEDPPASGKSEFYKRLIVDEPGRYLLAVPTQRLLDEHAHGRDGLRARIAAAGLPPPSRWSASPAGRTSAASAARWPKRRASTPTAGTWSSSAPTPR